MLKELDIDPHLNALIRNTDGDFILFYKHVASFVLQLRRICVRCAGWTVGSQYRGAPLSSGTKSPTASWSVSSAMESQINLLSSFVGYFNFSSGLS